MNRYSAFVILCLFGAVHIFLTDSTALHGNHRSNCPDIFKGYQLEFSQHVSQLVENETDPLNLSKETTGCLCCLKKKFEKEWNTVEACGSENMPKMVMKDMFSFIAGKCDRFSAFKCELCGHHSNKSASLEKKMDTMLEMIESQHQIIINKTVTIIDLIYGLKGNRKS